MIIDLNHFKFYGGTGKYYDRGFALLMESVFGINILKFSQAFDAYLTSDKTKASGYHHSSKGTYQVNATAKERILDDFFLDDMRFMQKLHEDGSVMVNSYFGAMLYAKRTEYNKPFNTNDFLDFQNNNDILKALLGKIKDFVRLGDEREKKIVDQILEIYETFFDGVMGKKVEKTFAEKMQETKDIAMKLRKDKSLLKLTKHKRISWVEDMIREKFLKGVDLKFHMVVYPHQKERYGKDNWLDYGVYNDIEVTALEKKWNSETITLYLIHDDKKLKIWHTGFNNWGSYSSKYSEVDNQKMELFLEVTPEELKKINNK